MVNARPKARILGWVPLVLMIVMRHNERLGSYALSRISAVVPNRL